MKRMGLGVSEVEWTTTFDFVCKVLTLEAAQAGAAEQDQLGNVGIAGVTLHGHVHE